MINIHCEIRRFKPSQKGGNQPERAVSAPANNQQNKLVQLEQPGRKQVRFQGDIEKEIRRLHRGEVSRMRLQSLHPPRGLQYSQKRCNNSPANSSGSGGSRNSSGQSSFVVGGRESPLYAGYTYSSPSLLGISGHATLGSQRGRSTPLKPSGLNSSFYQDAGANTPSHAHTLTVTLVPDARGEVGLHFEGAPPLIASVQPGSPAHRSGVLQRGDRVLAVSGVSCSSLSGWQTARLTRVGGAVTMIVQFRVAQAVVPSSGLFTVRLACRQNRDLGIALSAPHNKSIAPTISEVRRGSVAHRCGALHPGDKILEVGGVALGTGEKATEMLLGAASGRDLVELRVLKRGTRGASIRVLRVEPRTPDVTTPPPVTSPEVNIPPPMTSDPKRDASPGVKPAAPAVAPSTLEAPAGSHRVRRELEQVTRLAWLLLYCVAMVLAVRSGSPWVLDACSRLWCFLANLLA